MIPEAIETRCSVLELRALLQAAAAAPRPCVSVFLSSPSERGFAALKAVPLELREAEEQAARDLERAGIGEEARARLLAPLAQLRERVGSTGSSPDALPPLPWTLALWLGNGGDRIWSFGARIPALVRPLAAVSRAPHVLPLLELLLLEQRFRVLALSVNRVALFEGDARGVRAVDAPLVPASLVEALGERLESPEDLQQHTAAPAPRAGAGRRAVVHHGQGGAPAERALDLERYHRVVARTVGAHWRGQEEVPLVLLADASHHGPSLRAGLPGLDERVVDGNPDRLSPAQIHAAAWPLVRAHAAGERARTEAALEEARGQGSLFREGLEPLAEAAVQGRIARLWIAADAAHPGRIAEPGSQVIDGWPGEDALDQLAGLVLRYGGEVHVLARGHGSAVAGLLRA